MLAPGTHAALRDLVSVGRFADDRPTTTLEGVIDELGFDRETLNTAERRTATGVTQDAAVTT